jgi:hypothetical protein
MGASSLYAQEVKIYLRKVGSSDAHYATFEICKGDRVQVISNGYNFPIDSLGYEYKKNGVWESANQFSPTNAPVNQGASFSMTVSSKESADYRLKFYSNSLQPKYSNTVSVIIKSCAITK